MASTFECSKCKECVRVETTQELLLLQSEHRVRCKGEYKSIWRNYDKMTNKEIKELASKVMYKYGKLGKIR